MNLKTDLKELMYFSEGLKVLYVEDDEQIRQNTMNIFNTIFAEVEQASNGKEGVEKFEAKHHDLVITDILMPEMNGLDMIRSIKKINPDQTVIVTSACEESNYLLDLINQGVAQFIVKPLQLDHMVRVLKNVVQNIYNARKVYEMTLNLQKEVLHQSTLLEQYKEIVDIATIVSKTDKKGKITYVNEAFCRVSGYSEKELIGKAHNIIRHPDVPKEVFKNLWDTITAKKIWHGTIKNRKKDGGYYYTDSTVKPILDPDGNILEFISIRHDVTMLYDLNEEIWHTQHELLSLLGEVGETRSQETGYHVKRVAKYSKLLAELYGLNEEETNLLYSASPMHDIGKIGIPDDILLKPGPLNDEEFTIMKTHAQIGYDILKNSNRPMLKAAAIIAYEHHERWDGKGYPQGIAADEIHIYGRITALCDVFDALGCDRAYKKAWPLEKVLQLIEEQRGKQFDPKLVDLFLENIEQFKKILEEYRDA